MTSAAPNNWKDVVKLEQRKQQNMTSSKNCNSNNAEEHARAMPQNAANSSAMRQQFGSDNRQMRNYSALIVNDLKPLNCDEQLDPLTARRLKRERQRRRIRKGLSWTFLALAFPLWLFIFCVREKPDCSSEQEAEQEYAEDFCCPCFYTGGPICADS